MMDERERRVVCEECGEVIEYELIGSGEDDADRIIDAYEHGCIEEEEDDG
jgi:transcription initiation factor TFIIIB Brf1 subunit/transcription initiation factor TFIIB